LIFCLHLLCLKNKAAQLQPMGKTMTTEAKRPVKSPAGTKVGGPRKWKTTAPVVTLAGVVLLGAGIWLGSTLSDPTASDAYAQLAQSKAGVEADYKQLQENYTVLDGQFTTLQSGIDDREAKVGDREDAVGAAEKKAEAALAAVKKREDAVTGAEAKKARNTVGDGTWTVGRSIDPGTYVTTADVGASCYWGLYTSGSNGSDIIDNDLPGGGRPQVTISAGQDFKTARCGTWTKQ
jgi:hypothetical protein